MAETLIKVVNASGSKVSLSSGYLFEKFDTKYIPISKLQFDEKLLADLSSQITAGHLTAYIGGISQSADDVETLVAGWTAEAVHQHTDYQESITKQHDPTAALPTTPSDGDRYWSLATANGWTINKIYVYDTSTTEYTAVTPTKGTQFYDEYTNMIYVWNGTALNSITEATRIQAKFTAVNVKTTAAYTATLNGLSTDGFVPKSLVCRLSAVAGGLNGNLEITLGTSVGGTQLLSATTLTGLTTVNNTFTIDITGLIAAAIAANATLHLSTTSADTGAGTGTLEAWVEGLNV